MAPTEMELAQARAHVAQAAKAVDDQRARLTRLRQHGHPTGDAEELLATFEQVLSVMHAHLTVELSFERDATA